MSASIENSFICFVPDGQIYQHLLICLLIEWFTLYYAIKPGPETKNLEHIYIHLKDKWGNHSWLLISNKIQFKWTEQEIIPVSDNLKKKKF